jgi:hypothetical protein
MKMISLLEATVLLEKLEWCGAGIPPLYKLNCLEIRTMNMGSGEALKASAVCE